MSQPEAALPLDQVLHGDCLELLGTLPEKSVDMVFADPPYNLQLSGDLWRPNLTRVDAVDDAWDRFESFAEYDEFTRRWLAACRRVLKDTGTLWVIGTYHNIFRVGTVLQNLGYWILNDVVWIKANPMPNFRGVRFTNAHETLIWAQKVAGARYTFNHKTMKALNEDLQMRSDWTLPLCTGRERLRQNGVKAHPTQKPEALLYRVISASTNPGDVVLDPFFGTGTTGMVAARLRRRYIGIERDERYARLARQRLETVQLEEAGPEVFHQANPPRPPRLPFGALLETGLVQPGQRLVFGTKAQTAATVLPNGHLSCQGQTGSIHQMARMLANAPCNGWEHWYVVDEATGGLTALGRLRDEALRLEAQRQAGPLSDVVI